MDRGAEGPPAGRLSRRPRWRAETEDLYSRMEVWVATGAVPRTRRRPPVGPRSMVWMRLSEAFPIDAPTLAIMADMVPSGVIEALENNAFGTRLDNTLRIIRIVPTDWVLCDIRTKSVQRGFAHGTMDL